MGGTLLNVFTVLLGGTLGLLIGNRLSERIQQSITTGLGLVAFVVGLSNAQTSGNIIIPLLATVIGVIVGEVLRIDLALERLGGWLQARLTRDAADGGQRERFITGFVTASLLFCVGPLTIVGSVQDGMGLAVGFQALAIKSVLDGFAAMAFAASFGVGVLATVFTILVVQGGLALAGALLIGTLGSAGDVELVRTAPAVVELTATGGILLMGLALALLEIKRPRVANFLPALLIAPLIVVAAQALGVNLYP
jgi:uncharacterized membrane protein YqgA involved in biofilm formation